MKSVYCDRCKKQTDRPHDVYLSRKYFDDDDELERSGGRAGFFGNKYELQLCSSCFRGLRKVVKSFLKEGRTKEWKT